MAGRSLTRTLNLPDTVAFKGMLLNGVPNFAYP
jgi:hypothetical protein